MRLQLHAYCTACMLMYGMPKSMPAAEAALGGDDDDGRGMHVWLLLLLLLLALLLVVCYAGAALLVLLCWCCWCWCCLLCVLLLVRACACAVLVLSAVSERTAAHVYRLDTHRCAKGRGCVHGSEAGFRARAACSRAAAG